MWELQRELRLVAGRYQDMTSPDPYGVEQSDPYEVEQFELHLSYREFMGGGRRKPALPIAAPTVTWHTAHWMPLHLVGNHKTWVANVEKFALSLYMHLEELAADDAGFKPHTRSLQRADTPEPELYLLNNIYLLNEKKFKEIEGQATRYQMFRLHCFYGGAPVSIGIELHDEFFTISTQIDVGPQPDARHTSNKDNNDDYNAIDELKNAIRKFNNQCTKRLMDAEANESEASKDYHRAALTEPYKEIYFNVWKRFFERVFAASYRRTKRDKNRLDALGRVIANFRGLIASTSDKQFIVGPEEHQIADSALLGVGEQFFSRIQAIHYADTLVPWLKADRGFDVLKSDWEPNRTEPIEFTFTRFLGRRVLYATALGAQYSRLRGKQAPVTYMMLSRNQAGWQLGGLADLIHLLGTLRLAALYDLQHLINAGFRFRLIDPRLDKLIGTLRPGKPTTGASDGDIAITGEVRPDTLRKITKKVIQLSQLLSNAASQAGHRGERPQIAGGLAHRTERSQYYRVQFELFAKRLAESAVEGFPSYTDSINRRLGGVYELIDMIGSRYNRLQSKVAVVTQEIQAAQSTQLLDTIRDFQHIGEIIAFLVLMPDAGGNIIERVFGRDSALIVPGTIAFFVVGTVIVLRHKITWRLRMMARSFATWLRQAPPENLEG